MYEDTAEAVVAATRELLQAIIAANDIKASEVASVIFTATPDLAAAPPAVAAREMGWTNVPLLCMQEMPVNGALPRAVRVLIHWNTTTPQDKIVHIYLHDAKKLRPDLVQRERPADLIDRRVTIVGLGLIGGSLALALRDQVAHLAGVDADPRTVALALERGVTHAATTGLAEGVRDADIVVLAAPVRANLAIIEQIGPLLKEGCILMDVGSSKTDVCSAMRKLPAHVIAVGGHPMAGKETAGLKAADGDLFVDRPFVLCGVRHGIPRLVEALVRATGAFPLPLEPERHDRLAAAISHVPYLLSVALVRMVAQVSLTDPWVWTLAATGFGDVSRVAASDATMMEDILVTNRAPVVELATLARTALDELIAAIDPNQEGPIELRAQLVEAQAARLGWARDRR
ncbi:MAG: chorismate mutase [Anaerolineae bacterium]|nr:chorismate mutase [Anaerolineae bacterium]